MMQGSARIAAAYITGYTEKEETTVEKHVKNIEKIKAYGIALHKKKIADRTWKQGKNKLRAYTVEGDEDVIAVYGKGGYLEIPTQKAEALALMLIDAAFMAEKKKQAKTIKYVKLGDEYVSALDGEYPGMQRYRQIGETMTAIG